MWNKLLLLVTFSAVLLVLHACSAAESEFQARKPLVRTSQKRISGLPKEIPVPSDNPLTDSKVKLGKLLFFDPVLSGDKDVSCATCHHPTSGYADNRAFSIGVNGTGQGSRRAFNLPNEIPLVKRNSQTVLNTAFNGISSLGKYDAIEAPMFWDLRAKSLESQALEPIKAFEEMRGQHFAEEEILEEVLKRLQRIPAYVQLFKEAFGPESDIDLDNLARAIATFERTLVTNNSRFDQYMRGDDSAISISEQEGFILFKKAGCDNCHNGPMFSDYKIHVLGVPEQSPEAPLDDGFENGQGFRTPTLRNLNVTAPYMHNGSMTSLLRVLEFYEDISGTKLRNPKIPRESMDPLINEIRLSVPDMRPIISFLNCLNDDDYDREIPLEVPSGLTVGGN